MTPSNLDTILKRFEHPDEVRTFEKGRLEMRFHESPGSGNTTSMAMGQELDGADKRAEVRGHLRT
jgi:hypothetical protein